MLTLKQLNDKAMMVRLTISKPATSKRDESAEQFTQSSLQDAGLKVSATLFKEKTNPVRTLLNSANAVYHYHKQHTIPYIDRGPRLLPVAMYETYRDAMRKLIGEVQADLQRVMPEYDLHVQNDIAFRNGSTGQGRATVADYPTREQFEASFKMEFSFSPLPSNAHWLFDVAPEDRAALDALEAQTAEMARADMYGRLREPVRKLLEKLKVPAGTPGAIFRDTAVTNVSDAVDLVRQLAMGDEVILKMCEDVERTVAPVLTNPDVLRESPVVREAAAARLKEVSDRMGFMFENA